MKKAEQGYKGIPATHHRAVRALLALYYDDPKGPKTPAQAWKWLQESSKQEQQRKAEEQRKQSAEAAEHRREWAREGAQKAIIRLAVARDALEAIEKGEADIQPYIDECNLAGMIRLSVIDAGRALESALMLYGLIKTEKEGDRFFNHPVE